MVITFGKFNGWDTESLAKSGSIGLNYLIWGSDNLRSPKWKAEFERVLSLNLPQDDNLAAEAIMADAPDIEFGEAHRIARETKMAEAEMKAEMEAHEKKIAEFVQKWATKFGVNNQAMRQIGAKMIDWAEYGGLGRENFSSQEKYELGLAFVADADKNQIDRYSLSGLAF